MVIKAGLSNNFSPDGYRFYYGAEKLKKAVPYSTCQLIANQQLHYDNTHLSRTRGTTLEHYYML